MSDLRIRDVINYPCPDIILEFQISWNLPLLKLGKALLKYDFSGQED